MQFKASARYIRISPFKLRPLVDVVRGSTVDRALAFLRTCSIDRAKSIEKVIFSAYSNAVNLQQNVAMNDLVIKEIKVDQGPTFKYFKPSAMGRAQLQKKRLSHISVLLEKH
jgi:large subunit ribosomal protein L22